MVRGIKDSADGPPKKKAASKKRSSNSSIWPCKMNGCNKQFAREADLKRHQRTTKSHSTPGFQCPQCEATFTRTDALRRHQKSRHNGVIVDLPEQDQVDSVQDSQSRSASPGRETASGAMPNAPGPSGYYRPHTGNPHHFPPPPPVDGSPFPSVGHPTSSTRHWPPPPPWATPAEPPQPSMGIMPYPGSAGPMPPGGPFFAQSSHYRVMPHAMVPPTQSPNDPHPRADMSNTNLPPPVPPNGVNINGQLPVAPTGIPEDQQPCNPVIDPSLEQQLQPLHVTTEPSANVIIPDLPAVQNSQSPIPVEVTTEAVTTTAPEAAEPSAADQAGEVQQYSTMDDAEGDTDREDDDEGQVVGQGLQVEPSDAVPSLS
ncbi:hypothetical protein BDV98DRAFT_145987 [Pterulicium gracile]|uniref:C2H2-type domain-containing protein n=1 Tax=Pterulicium gracile TaxID=1884261 RepID=A0A5C3R149_9AGAR|nr:hypothetical protein BDV98DRAFT_145987 [Pterula gracilis]